MTATGTNVNTESARAALAKTDNDPLSVAKADLARMRGQFELVLPPSITPDRLIRVLQTVVTLNPNLADPACRQSLLGAAMTCAQLGLDPTPAIGHAYIIPFKDHGRPVATFVLGYKGAVWLAADNGVHFKSQAICEHDEYDVQLGTQGYIRHRMPAFATDMDRGRALAYYCIAKFPDSAYEFEVMTSVEVERIRQRSPGKNSPAWTQNYDEMAKKTVLKRLAKNVPLGVKASEAFAHDGAVRLDTEPEALSDTPTFTEDDVAEAEVVEFDPVTGEQLPADYGGVS